MRRRRIASVAGFEMMPRSPDCYTPCRRAGVLRRFDLRHARHAARLSAHAAAALMRHAGAPLPR